MFSLTIALGNVSWQLLYHEEKTAEEAYAALNSGNDVFLKDDFGQRLHAIRSMIGGFLFEDLDKSALARIEMGLHQARMQTKGNQMAENDPVLKQARQRQSMGILAPMGPGPGMPGFPSNGRG